MKIGKILTFLVLVTLLFSGCKTSDNTQVNKNYWIQNTTEVKSGFVGLKPTYILDDGEEINFSFLLKNHSNTTVTIVPKESFKCKDKNGQFIKMRTESEKKTIILKPDEEKLEGVGYNYKEESKGELEFIFQSATDAEAVSLFVKRKNK
jgi:uncharacterized protein YcfL